MTSPTFIIPIKQLAIGNLTSKTDVSTYTYGSKSHAVTAADSNSYTYDANGNMTERNEAGKTYAQSWSVENYLDKVDNTTDGLSVAYGRDANNKLLRKTTSDASGFKDLTAYFEPVELHYTAGSPNASVTSYYLFGGQRVAINKGGMLTYFHSDHARDYSRRLGQHSHRRQRRGHRQQRVCLQTLRRAARRQHIYQRQTYTGKHTITIWGC